MEYISTPNEMYAKVSGKAKRFQGEARSSLLMNRLFDASLRGPDRPATCRRASGTVLVIKACNSLVRLLVLLSDLLIVPRRCRISLTLQCYAKGNVCTIYTT